MTMRQVQQGSEADRHHWKWERMKEAEILEKTYRQLGHVEVADGWAREAERIRQMVKPQK